MGPGRLRAPLTQGLLKLNMLWEAVGCEDCVTFARQSFQMLLGPCSTCCREGRGRQGHPDAPGADGASDRKLPPASDGSLRFRSLSRDLARHVEGDLHCRTAPGVAARLLNWAEGPHGRQGPLPFLQCLCEMREEALAEQTLSRLPDAGLEIGTRASRVLPAA